MRNSVQQRTKVSGHVRVPRVRVCDVGSANDRSHLKIDPESLKRSVCPHKFNRHGMSDGIGAGLAKALNVNVDELAQLGHEVFDMNPGATVNVRGPLTSKDLRSHPPYSTDAGMV